MTRPPLGRDDLVPLHEALGTIGRALSRSAWPEPPTDWCREWCDLERFRYFPLAIPVLGPDGLPHRPWTYRRRWIWWQGADGLPRPARGLPSWERRGTVTWYRAPTAQEVQTPEGEPLQVRRLKGGVYVVTPPGGGRWRLSVLDLGFSWCDPSGATDDVRPSGSPLEPVLRRFADHPFHQVARWPTDDQAGRLVILHEAIERLRRDLVGGHIRSVICEDAVTPPRRGTPEELSAGAWGGSLDSLYSACWTDLLPEAAAPRKGPRTAPQVFAVAEDVEALTAEQAREAADEAKSGKLGRPTEPWRDEVRDRVEAMARAHESTAEKDVREDLDARVVADQRGDEWVRWTSQDGSLREVRRTTFKGALAEGRKKGRAAKTG